MSLDPPTYVISLQNNIRARPISWEGAVRAKTISDSDLKKIKAIDKVRKEQRKQTLDSETDSYISLFLGGKDGGSIFQAASKRQDIIQYMLVMADDVIEGIAALPDMTFLYGKHHSNVLVDGSTFVSALIKHSDPYSPFIPLLKQSSNLDDPVPLLAASVLTKLLSQAIVASGKPTTQLESTLTKLYSYLSSLSKSSDAGYQDIAVQSYSAVLRTKKAREQFWKQREETVNPLINILHAGTGVSKDTGSTLWSEGASSSRAVLGDGIAGGAGIQLLYHVLLVFWQLSFEGQLVGDGLQE
jgi:V-type H+-transporting ATPase subunit H